MNYKDLIGIENPNFEVLAVIPNFCKQFKNVYVPSNYSSLNVYKVFEDRVIASVGKEGIKEIYDIKHIDGKDYIVPDNKKYNQVCLDDMVILGLTGKIEDNKVYPDYFRQGNIYKNNIVYESTKNLTKEELDELPLKKKICYIPEHAFDTNDYIDLNLNNLKDGIDYYTINGIRKDIMTTLIEEEYYYRYQKDGKPYVIEAGNFDKKLINQMTDYIFNEVDWQYPSSLINEIDWSEDIKTYYDNKINSLGEEYGL